MRNKAVGMSSHSIREFKVMMKSLKLPPKGGGIMVIVVAVGVVLIVAAVVSFIALQVLSNRGIGV